MADPARAALRRSRAALTVPSPVGRVLVIEDEPEVLDTLREMLIDLGWDVSTALDAEQGRAAVLSARPDVVILDLVLPGRSGFDLLPDLQRDHPDLPVIAITATIQPEIERLVRAKGAFGYLAKPIDLAALDALLTEALQRARVPRRTILHIEDNAANVRLMEVLFEQRPGVRLLTARNARTGLSVALESRPDLILLDLHLPDMEGADLLRALRAAPELAATPVIIVSAEAEPGLPERMRAAGAQGYLEKPLDFPRFFELVDRMLAPGPR